MTHTQQAIDASEVSDLIAEALGATGILPPMARLEELDRLLRVEIARLVQVATRQADAIPLRSREWYALVQAAERAADVTQYQLGAAPLAGAIHIGELARRVCELHDTVKAGET
ncbi:DUF6415 family natural product biosynthesis protein [Streptomyces sp. NPDC047065]|uniref:DUF6415 family natural product biosynthesis protein n=1 Tax=Streptomyces sp. NPDC047065 TaxID=3154606 RepID=UPI0033F2D572